MSKRRDDRIVLARSRADQLVGRAFEHARRALASNERALRLLQRLRAARQRPETDQDA
jgi:hypothetical protein